MHPLCKLLDKEVKFIFNDTCPKKFECLEVKLTSAPIVISPDWSMPFEVMCDASRVALGTDLGQRHEKILYPIYYASKTLNPAQKNYTMTEQELLDVGFVFEKF